MSVEVCAVGDVNVDLVTSPVSDFPPRDGQVVVEDVTLTTGGCAANFARAISKLGAKTRLFAKLGNDIFGDFVRKDLEGVDLQFADGKKTGVTLAVTFEDQCRSFFTYPGGNSEFRLEDVNFSLLEGKFLHTASHALTSMSRDTIELMKKAQAKGLKVSYDPGPNPLGVDEKDRKEVLEIISNTDFLFLNQKEADDYIGLKGADEIADYVLGFGVEVFVLKMGKKGCTVFFEEGKEAIPPFKVENVVDTTGAGDVFDAGFIYGQLQDWDVLKSGRFAAACAAISIQSPGNTGYPDPKTVEDFLS
ncbi:MAG: carbohydrate kinase family protein [Candidatus Altiarchaeota archaeon]